MAGTGIVQIVSRAVDVAIGTSAIAFSGIVMTLFLLLGAFVPVFVLQVLLVAGLHWTVADARVVSIPVGVLLYFIFWVWRYSQWTAGGCLPWLRLPFRCKIRWHEWVLYSGDPDRRCQEFVEVCSHCGIQRQRDTHIWEPKDNNEAFMQRWYDWTRDPAQVKAPTLTTWYECLFCRTTKPRDDAPALAIGGRRQIS